jgi:hypothetical protein
MRRERKWLNSYEEPFSSSECLSSSQFILLVGNCASRCAHRLCLWPTTTLQPLALVVLPGGLILAYAILKPSVILQKGLRAYLVCCVAASELLSNCHVLGSDYAVSAFVKCALVLCVTMLANEYYTDNSPF